MTDEQKELIESQVDFLTALTESVSLLSKIIQSNREYTHQVECFAKTLIRLEDKIDNINRNTTKEEKVEE